MNIIFNVSKSGAPLADGLLFLTPVSSSSSIGAIMTDSGDLVWSLPTGDYANLRVATVDGQPALTYWNGSGSPNVGLQGHGYGAVEILDMEYNKIHSICPNFNLTTVNNTVYPCQADVHESFVTDRNTLLVTAYNVTQANLTSVGGPSDGWVYDSLFFEIDIQTQDILFRWSALEHVDVAGSNQGLIDPTGGVSGTIENPWDFFHINSVEAVGDRFLVNSRHYWTFYMLNCTGDIQWHLEGGTGGDFTLPQQNLFKWEHDVRAHNVTPTSLTVVFFNNNNTIPASTTNQTSTLYLDLDLTTQTTTIQRELFDPAQPLFVSSQGAAAPLANGNSFMGYGQLPVMKEFAPSSAVAMSIQFGDLNSTQSYRAYRQPWSAVPSADPVAVVDSGKVYMSWNGATDVCRWEVYEGATEDKMVMKSRVASSGFETSVAVGNGTQFVRVTAYSGDNVQRNSNTVRLA